MRIETHIHSGRSLVPAQAPRRPSHPRHNMLVAKPSGGDGRGHQDREEERVYRRILLASDGTRESLVALREGALVARAFRAAAFLLIVEPETVGHRMADGVSPVPRHDQQAQELLSSNLSRLSRLGVGADGEW